LITQVTIAPILLTNNQIFFYLQIDENETKSNFSTINIT
jgi:hypothetical protein